MEALFDASQAIVRQLDLEFLTVTLAERGIAVLWEDRRIHASASAREVYDVTGAGDTVIAVLALSLARGLEIQRAAEVVNLAAVIIVAKHCTAPIQRDELLGTLSKRITNHTNNKVVSVEELLRRVGGW